MIWRLAGLEPRAVEFEYYPKQGNITSKFPSKTIVPAILHTSREARSVGLELYEKLNFGGAFCRTFINWEVDIVLFQEGLRDFLYFEHLIHNKHVSDYLHWRSKIGSAHSIIDQKCQRLAIHEKDFLIISPELKPHNFGQLKELLIVCRPKRLGSFKDGNLTLMPADQENQALSVHQNEEDESESEYQGIQYGPVHWRYSEIKSWEKKIRDMQTKHPRITKGCVMDMKREQHRLMTPAEKKARKDVQQGRKTIQEALALKQKLDLPLDSNKRERDRKKKMEDMEEQKRKQFEDDLIVAAK